MMERKPANNRVLRRVGKALLKQVQVGEEVRVAHHHALRGGGGARGVLEQGERVGSRFRRAPGARVRAFVDGQPGDAGE